MGIFRHFPYTNFHDLNLEWVISKIKELWEGVYDINEKVDDFIVNTEPLIRDEVDNWLDNHPEATTTVEDGSLTEIKFSPELAAETIKDYVTPQMYGAKGDGQTDDTYAFIDMFSSLMPVLIPKGNYNITRFFFEDDSRVINDYGNYTNKRVIVSKNISDNGIAVAPQNCLKFSDYGIKNLQSAAFNTRTGKLILGSELNDNDVPTIIEIDYFGTKQLLRSLPNSIFNHCNDITYNPKTDNLYIAPMNGSEIVVVDATLFALKPSINISDLNNIHQISYDEKNDIYYISDSTGTYVYDYAFTRIKRLTTGPIKDATLADVAYDNIQSTGSQGSCVYNEQFISYGWMFGKTSYSSYGRLSQLNYAESKSKVSYDHMMTQCDDEPEGLAVYDGYIYAFSYYGDIINVYKIDPEADGKGTENGIINIPVSAVSVSTGNAVVNSISLKGNGNAYLIKMSISATEEIAGGTNITIRVNSILNFEGILYGFVGNSVVIGSFFRNEIYLRVIGATIGAWSVTLRGVLLPTYFE